MPEKKSHAPGSWCWPEAAVADAAESKAFWGGLLGWDLRDAQGGGYVIAHRKGMMVAGIYALSPEQKARKVPPHWLGYVRVASADDAAKKAAGLGAKVLAAPFDVPGVGRMAAVEDPAGAGFAVWEPKGMEGSALVDEPGAPCWYELMTPDPERAAAFYTGLFDWTAKTSALATSAGGPYTEFHNGKDMACGMMATPPELRGKAPACWTPYIAVEDCDATAKECTRLGGTVRHPPTDIPKVGRFSVLAAPDGATLAVIRLGG